MHTQKIGLHSQAPRKEAQNRGRTTLTLTDQTKALLEKLGNGSMSDGVYLSSQIVAQLLHQKIITVEFDQGGVVYRLESGKILAATPRSGKDEAKKIHRAKVADLLTPKPEINPYAGRGLTKKELVATGHFTHRQIRSIAPGQRVSDRFGFWWERVDTPHKPERDQRGFRNSRGRLMASYIGLASQDDNWERYSEELGRLI